MTGSCRGAAALSVAVGKGTGMPSWMYVLDQANEQRPVQVRLWPHVRL